MCGRFTQRFTWQQLHDLLQPGGPARNLRPRFNLAPGQDAAVVRAAAPAAGGGTERSLSLLRWGLVPSWSRDVRIGNRLINARSETAATKPAFRAAYRARRCLVPADGFYEWARTDGNRQAWLVEPDAGLLLLAGLWEAWTVPPDSRLPNSLAHLEPGARLETFTLLTRPATGSMARIHHRMPVLLPPEAVDAWLAGQPLARDRPPATGLTFCPVSDRVNRPANDDAACVRPLSPAPPLPPA